MPRPNPLRTLQSEENLARRIAYEREQRGWSYEGTAVRMTYAGCPLQGSAIYKIEKGSPRRRITLDESVAFARVFGLELPDLLIPVELLDRQKLAQATEELVMARRALLFNVVALAEKLHELGLLIGPTDATNVVSLVQKAPDAFPIMTRGWPIEDQLVPLLGRVVDGVVEGVFNDLAGAMLTPVVSQDESEHE